MISPAIAGFRPVTKTASRHESSSSLQAHGWCGRDRRCPPAPRRLRLQRQERLCHLGQASLFREQQHEGGRMALRDLCRNSSFLAVNVAIFLGGALELGLAQWLPAYAEMSLGFSKWTGSISLLAFSAAMALGRIFAGLIGRRVDPIKLMLSCCWTSVVLFLLACFAPWPAVALAASVAVGLTGSCLWPTTLGVAADRFPRGGASMFGLLAAFGNRWNSHAVAGWRDGGLVIPATRLGHLDSLPPLDGLYAFVDAASSCCGIEGTPAGKPREANASHH